MAKSWGKNYQCHQGSWMVIDNFWKKGKLISQCFPFHHCFSQYSEIYQNLLDLQPSKQVPRDIFFMDNEYLTLFCCPVLSIPDCAPPSKLPGTQPATTQHLGAHTFLSRQSCALLVVIRTIKNVLFTWGEARQDMEWGDNQEAGWLCAQHLPSSSLQLCSEVSQKQKQRADPSQPVILHKSSYRACLVLKYNTKDLLE